jgi:hypothetical protein
MRGNAVAGCKLLLYHGWADPEAPVKSRQLDEAAGCVRQRVDWLMKQ